MGALHNDIASWAARARASGQDTIYIDLDTADKIVEALLEGDPEDYTSTIWCLANRHCFGSAVSMDTALIQVCAKAEDPRMPKLFELKVGRLTTHGSPTSHNLMGGDPVCVRNMRHGDFKASDTGNFAAFEVLVPRGYVANAAGMIEDTNRVHSNSAVELLFTGLISATKRLTFKATGFLHIALKEVHRDGSVTIQVGVRGTTESRYQAICKPLSWEINEEVQDD